MTQLQTSTIEMLRDHFEINGYNDDFQQNVWIMALALVPYNEKPVNSILGTEGPPSHTIRLVLRTTDEAGTNDYVDGTDVYIRLDNNIKAAVFVWEDLWAEGPPIFHGGTVPAALRWVSELDEPFYLQLKDPFLTSEQRIALNGHDDDYIEPAPEQPNEENDTKQLIGDDFEGIF